MRRTIKYLLAFTISGLAVLANPQAAFAQDGKPPVNVWALRSEKITDSLIGDATSLEAFERSLLFARLGDAWWPYDRARARSWIQKSVEIVEYMPDQQSPAEHAKRLATARAVLGIVKPRDENLVGHLNEILEVDAKDRSKTQNDRRADALIAEALVAVKSDPQRAAALGAESLRGGHPERLSQLFWELRSRDSNLANDLFLQGVSAARETYDPGLLWSLLHIAFPVLSGGKAENSGVPDLFRSQLGQAVAAYFQHAQVNLTEPGALCLKTASMIFAVASIRSELDRLLPAEQSSFLRQLIIGCQSSLNPIVQERVKESERSQPLKTVDDFLEAADKVKDSSAKTVLQARAAWLAVEQKKFDRALSILEYIDADGRKFLNGEWQRWRSEWAALSALEYLKHDDLDGMRRVIGAVPSGLRPPSQISLAYGASTQHKYGDLVLSLLRDAREGLPKSDLTNTEKAQWSVTLLKLYAKLLPADAFVVLRETVAALNRTEKANPATEKDLGDPSKSELVNLESPYDLPLSIFESDDFAFLGAISSIESPTRRAKIRLELLSSSLSLRNVQTRPKTKDNPRNTKKYH